MEERYAQSKGEGVDLIGQPCSFKAVTSILGGWRQDEMYVFGGATGSGKSSFLLGELKHVAMNGGTSVYFSLEMSAKVLALRTLSAITGLPAMAIERGRLKPASLEALKEAIFEFSKINLHIYDHGMSVKDMELVLNQHKLNNHLDVVGVDYIGLVRDNGTTPYERTTNIATNLRRAAKTFDIPLLAAQQLNRASLTGRPTLSALKESGQVENDAGAVIFPYRHEREDDDDPNYDRGELIVAKNRHGPNNVTVPARFYFNQMVWSPIDNPIIEPPKIRT